jgi:AraC-like DNA-binding protein
MLAVVPHTAAAPVDPAEALREEMVALAAACAPTDGTHATAVPGFSVIRASAPGQPLPAVYEPGLVFVVQGRKQAMFGGQTLVYDPLHYLLVSVTVLPLGQILQATPDRPYLCLRLNLDAAQLTDLLLQAQPEGGPPGPAAPGLKLARVSLPLADAVLRLLRLLREPRDIAVLAPLALREIYWRVLGGELGAQLRELAVADSHSQRIARAVELLKGRFAEPLRVEDLARTAHMSASTLHQHFKQVTSMSPLQYQKHLRLHHARRMMLADGLDAAAAAHRVGYESPSQFSREYRRLFGAPPKAEIAQVREAMAQTPAPR